MSVSLSFFIGLLFTALFFVFSALTVIGCKAIYLSVKVKRKKPEPKPQKPQTEPTQSQPKRTRAVRSIEINPDEVDQIFVKKIS